MIRRPLRTAALSVLLLSGCATAPKRAPVVAPTPAMPVGGLERVMGRTAPQLVLLLGDPDLDIREPAARKLVFKGKACVLDAYLYPPTKGGGEAVVTYLDARLPDGADLDRASCVAALMRGRKR